MENLEFSSSLDMIVSEGSGFRPLKTIDSQDLPCDGFGYLSIDYLENGNVGAFPNKKSWAKYINSVDYYGGSYIITKMIGKKLKGDYGCFCQIERDSIDGIREALNNRSRDKTKRCCTPDLEVYKPCISR